ncbi:MAG: hypothetical protein RLZZ210_1203, partial [Pseudomonadota bacterium]
MPNLGQPNLNKISTTPKTIRIVNTENNSNTAITSTNKIGQLGQGKNLKSNANAHESKQIKFNVEELDTIEFTSSIYDSDTGIKEKIQKKVKISEIESGDLYKITYKPNKVKLTEQQKLMLVDAIIKHNKSLFFDIDRMVLNLGFTNQKNLVSSLQKIIINLKKTLGTDDDGESFNYSKVNNICKNFHKFKITDERLKAQLCETIAQNFPISAIKHKDTLGISSKKALDRLKATRINKDDLEETLYNLHSCISRYSRQREGEKSLKSIMQILNQSSPIDQLAIAKKMLKTQPSSLIICLNYLKLSDSIKADLIKQIANTNFDDYHKKGRGYDIAHGKNIHPHLMLALYENSFRDKYKLNFSFEQFDKKANVLEMRLITTFITDNDYLFKNDELINKYGKLLDKFSLEEKHKLADLIIDYQQEGALSEVIKHFKFDEANRIKILDKIIAKHLKGETYVHLVSVMYELDNFEISDAEKRMKYFLHLSHRDVGYYFHSNFGIDEFVKPLKNLIKKSDDINQQYAIEHFTVLLL